MNQHLLTIHFQIYLSEQLNRNIKIWELQFLLLRNEIYQNSKLIALVLGNITLLNGS